MSRSGRYGGESKVYVGNLGTGAGKGELERAFGYYGPLRTVWIARNPPGFAFVEFEDPRDADDAVRGLDGPSVGVVCGWNSRQECRGALGTSGRRPAGRSTRTINVTSAEREVTTPTTATATAAAAAGAGPGPGPGPGLEGGGSLAAGAEGEGPGLPPEGLALQHRGGPGPGRVLEDAAGPVLWAALAPDLLPEAARRLAAAVRVRTEATEGFVGFGADFVVL
ncbi:RNA-binding protein Rsf1-like isoform X1 [Scomber japonicus]|uniref:RNA-binding protein Rsf1-like isoform X1 n=1 Tax=Scomber japonicus TaxID=13676 RepID=UPI0023052F06|nr:RNA-binding protein Rsf1-like isoform X1 [Scomber japonicus]XP_053194569.1 RNA-binding protein Rsf1-like isoform X1 [Scomber japonicus]XP_053194577.1 RNA-binding protein Rsf1-like isoform X1 [Scomber japonicus]